MRPEERRAGHEARSLEVCELCPHSFQCGALRTALRVLDAPLVQAQDPWIRRRYEAIRAELGVEGWRFPHGTAYCGLVGRPEELRRLTDELITLAAEAARRNAEPSLYWEEVSCE